MMATKKPLNIPSVLILECDSHKLANDGILIAQELNDIIKDWAPIANRHFIRTTTKDGLFSELQHLIISERAVFDVVVIVGHSCKSGLHLTKGRDGDIGWQQLAADWLMPLQPKTIILVACQGGRLLVAKALFKGIDTLQEVYGSPIKTKPREFGAVKILLPYLLWTKGLLKIQDIRHNIVNKWINNITSDVLKVVSETAQSIIRGIGISLQTDHLLTVINLLFTGGVIIRRTRPAVLNNRPSEEILTTCIEDFIRDITGR